MTRARKSLVAVGVDGLLAGARAGGRRLRARAERRGSTDRWLVVTVLRPPAEVSQAAAQTALEALGDAVETSVRVAPGDRGTELAARWRPGQQAGRSLDELRSALREAKQVLEVGEVLRSVPRPEGERPSTVGGWLVDLAERRSQGKGVR